MPVSLAVASNNLKYTILKNKHLHIILLYPILFSLPLLKQSFFPLSSELTVSTYHSLFLSRKYTHTIAVLCVSFVSSLSPCKPSGTVIDLFLSHTQIFFLSLTHMYQSQKHTHQIDLTKFGYGFNCTYESNAFSIFFL